MRLALSLCTFLLVPGTVSAQSALLDVPYLTQTPALCGGAALSMVLRYWGVSDVHPQDFAALVDHDAGGIPTARLAEAARARSADALLVTADPSSPFDALRVHVGRGRPLIALIEVSPRTFHYVVIVGLTKDAIVLHDPARLPFMVLPLDAFDRAWVKSDRWAMVVALSRPRGAGSEVDRAEAAASSRPASACHGLVRGAVDRAEAGDDADAEALLLAAIRLCPADVHGWREFAGLRFKASRWQEAARLADTAMRLAPDDTYARDLLATSRYLAGDRMGALEVWNVAKAPTIDVVSVVGAERTPHALIVETANLEPREVLTADAVRRAEQRVRALPALATARVHVEVVDGSRANVTIGVTERPAVPLGLVQLGTAGGRVVMDQEVRVTVAGVLRQAERFDIGWRWTDERPRLTGAVAFPAPGVSGVVSFLAEDETQTYRTAAVNTRQEVRRRFVLSFSDWFTGRVRWQFDAGRDRFDGRSHFVAGTNVELRFAEDHVSTQVGAMRWMFGHQSHSSGSARVTWRSHRGLAGEGWALAAAGAAVTDQAPLAIWPRASTRTEDASLRAHPLHEDDVVTSRAVGRRILSGGVQYGHRLGQILGYSIVGLGFLDIAHVRNGLQDAQRLPLFMDAGVGVRVNVPASPTALRLDLAHGLRDGRWAVSAGVEVRR